MMTNDENKSTLYYISGGPSFFIPIRLFFCRSFLKFEIHKFDRKINFNSSKKHVFLGIFPLHR